MSDVVVNAESAKPRRLSAAWDVVLVWSVLAVHGAWPAPDVNEAHYLAKAKHFWEPGWIEGDLFLSSRDSHVVFFATFGYLTHVLPLPAAAWCGRIVSWALLAWGWRRLSFALVPRFGFAALTIAAALGLNRWGAMAGEWFAGGLEAKGIAYALAFAALAELVSGRWNRGLATLGAASAFHVLVGGWSVAAAAVAWLLEGRARPALRKLAPGLLVGGMLALAGLIPALALARGTAAETVAAANEIYVLRRLDHHLYPQTFSTELRLRHAALYAGWIAFCFAAPADERLRRLRRFACGAAAIVVGGLAIAYVRPEPAPWTVGLLKFYWFRLSDVAVPAVLAMESAALARSALRPGVRNVATAVLVLVGVAHFASVAQQRIEKPNGRGDDQYVLANLPAWRDACGWIREHTPRDALFLTPGTFQTFKWYAERAEYATWKDVPQDAESLVRWKERIDALYRPGESFWFQFFPLERVLEVCRRYGVDYVVTFDTPPIELPIVYRNNGFAAYRVPP